MPNGKNNIKDNPKLNTNGFKQRPTEAGRPKGRKNNMTILRELLQAKDLEHKDPNTYLLNKALDIIEKDNTSQGVRLKAVMDLYEALNGKPKQTAEIINQTEREDYINPLIVIKNTPNAEELIKLGKEQGRAIIEIDEDLKEAYDKMKNM